ncbi:unnamed protein product, partial [Oppiella nova]
MATTLSASCTSTQSRVVANCVTQDSTPPKRSAISGFWALYSRWTNLQENDKTINVTLRMVIDGVSPLAISAQAQLQWPKLINKKLIKFPITRVGNITVSHN